MKVLSNKFYGYRNDHIRYLDTISLYKGFEENPYEDYEEGYQYWKELILDNFYGTATW